jgi:hypothetical protein
MVAFHGSDVDFALMLEDRPALIGVATAAISFWLFYLLWRNVCFVEKTEGP